MDTEEVRQECKRLTSITNKRRLAYSITSWVFAALEFTSGCGMVITSALDVFYSNAAYVTLVVSCVNVLTSGIHKYIGPEERAVSYNHQLRLCKSIRSRLEQIPDSNNSERAKHLLTYLQDIDFYMFSLSLPTTRSSDDLSNYSISNSENDVDEKYAMIDMRHSL